MEISIQLVSLVFTVFASGLSAYIGLKIANAENKKDIDYLAKEYNRLERKLERFEERFDKRFDR